MLLDVPVPDAPDDHHDRHHRDDDRNQSTHADSLKVCPDGPNSSRAERGVDAEDGVHVLAGLSSKYGLRKPAALVTLARNCHAVVD